MTDKTENQNEEMGFTQEVENDLIDRDNTPPSEGSGNIMDKFRAASGLTKFIIVCCIILPVLLIAKLVLSSQKPEPTQTKETYSKLDTKRFSSEGMNEVKEKSLMQGKKEVEEKKNPDLMVDDNLQSSSPKSAADDDYSDDQVSTKSARNSTESVSSVQPSTSADRPIRTPPSYAASAPKPASYMPPRQLQKRLSSEYQQVLRHYDSRQIVYSADESELAANNNPTGGIDKEYQNLYEGADRVSALNTFHMSAGDEIIAVLSENINTDHPSIAKAVVTSPRELNGATVLISFSLANDRISAIVQKLILPHDKGEKGMEISVAGVVKDGLPGIGGDVNRHYATQLAAGVAKAGLIGGTAYGLHQAGIGDDLGEAIVVAPMVQEATQGLTRPIDHWGRAKPATVKASAGQTFTILVTEGFEVKL